MKKLLIVALLPLLALSLLLGGCASDGDDDDDDDGAPVAETAAEKTLVGIEAATDGAKTTYLCAESFSTSGLQFSACWSDGSRTPIATTSIFFKISGKDIRSDETLPATAGDYTLTATYKQKGHYFTTTFGIVVVGWKPQQLPAYFVIDETAKSQTDGISIQDGDRTEAPAAVQVYKDGAELGESGTIAAGSTYTLSITYDYNTWTSPAIALKYGSLPVTLDAAGADETLYLAEGAAASERGVSLTFVLSGLASSRTEVGADWRRIFQTENHVLCLPKMELWADGAYKENFWPSTENGATFYNGGAWDTFCSTDEKQVVTINLAADGAVTYYQDAVKKLSYAPTAQICGTTMEAFVSALIAELGSGSIRINPDRAPLSITSLTIADAFDGDDGVAEAHKKLLPNLTRVTLAAASEGELRFPLGDTFYTGAFAVTADYSDGTTKTLDNGAVVFSLKAPGGDYTKATAETALGVEGTWYAKAAYTDIKGATKESGEIPFTVSTITSFRLDTSTAQTKFYIGEAFNSKGLAAKGYNGDREIGAIDSASLQVAAPATTALGTQTVTVSLGSLGAQTYTIEVFRYAAYLAAEGATVSVSKASVAGAEEAGAAYEFTPSSWYAYEEFPRVYFNELSAGNVVSYTFTETRPADAAGGWINWAFALRDSQADRIWYMCPTHFNSNLIGYTTAYVLQPDDYGVFASGTNVLTVTPQESNGCTELTAVVTNDGKEVFRAVERPMLLDISIGKEKAWLSDFAITLDGSTVPYKETDDGTVYVDHDLKGFEIAGGEVVEAVNRTETIDADGKPTYSEETDTTVELYDVTTQDLYVKNLNMAADWTLVWEFKESKELLLHKIQTGVDENHNPVYGRYIYDRSTNPWDNFTFQFTAPAGWTCFNTQPNEWTSDDPLLKLYNATTINSYYDGDHEAQNVFADADRVKVVFENHANGAMVMTGYAITDGKETMYFQITHEFNR